MTQINKNFCAAFLKAATFFLENRLQRQGDRLSFRSIFLLNEPALI
jgi:hypothetical protein